MYFKNLQPYRISTEWPITLDSLREQLSKRPARHCGSQDGESRGWASPAGGELVHAVGGQWLICLQTETKILPSSVVKRMANERADEIAQRQGYKLGRKQMKELCGQITMELLPTALAKVSRTYAWIDPVNGWLVVDASSQRKAEDVIEMLRHTLDTFPLALVRTNRSPMSAMADWMSAAEVPDGFTIDDACTVRSITEDRKEVSYRRGIDEKQIMEHLEHGCLPIKLALTFDDRISFVLTEKLEIKRLSFLDVVTEQIGEPEDAAALFDAEFALMAGELTRMLSAVMDALGGDLHKEDDLISQTKVAA